MSIFKTIASLFSSPAAPTTSATVISCQEQEVLTELEAGKAELAELQARAKKAQDELKAKTERAIKMKQAEQALVSTYKSLEQSEDLLEVLTESIKQAEEHIDSSTFSALGMARRLKQERMDKKMAKLGGAPRPRFIPIEAPVRIWNPPAEEVQEPTSALPPSFVGATKSASKSANRPTASGGRRVCPHCHTPNLDPQATTCSACGENL